MLGMGSSFRNGVRCGFTPFLMKSAAVLPFQFRRKLQSHHIYRAAGRMIHHSLSLYHHFQPFLPELFAVILHLEITESVLFIKQQLSTISLVILLFAASFIARWERI